MGEDEKQIHEGHRQRMYENFRRVGLEGFSDVQALELLLTFAIPRRDTNELAHRLLDQFGSFHAVFAAPLEALATVKGMSQRSALLVSLMPQLWRRAGIDEAQSTHKQFATTRACFDLLHNCFHAVRSEQLWVLCLDAKCHSLDLRKISDGSVVGVNLPMRKIVETALTFNASSVVLAHNHPSGIFFPSQEDLVFSKQLAQMLAQIDVVLADHLIFSEPFFYSLRGSGFF